MKQKLSTMGRALILNMQRMEAEKEHWCRLQYCIEPTYQGWAITILQQGMWENNFASYKPAKLLFAITPIVVLECEKLGLLEGYVTPSGEAFWGLTEAGRSLEISTISSTS